MKRFKFRLNPVIRYRQYRERMALIDLAGAKRALVETNNRIRQIKQTRKAAAMELEYQEAEGIGMDHYRIYTAYLDRLRRETESEGEHLVEIGRTIREKRKAVEVESINKQTLEWIKQTEYTKYLQEIGRAEQKAADELIGLRRRSDKF